MRHSIHIEAFGVRLRPVTEDDASFIVWLRNLGHAKGRLGDSAATLVAQQEWLRAYFDREGDYYFIVETLNGLPIGTHSLYNVAAGSAELGRWIIRPGVQAAAQSQTLTIDVAFSRLHVQSLRTVTVANNRAVLSINRKSGFRKVRIQPAGRVIGGKSVDLVHSIMTPEDWVAARKHLVVICRVAENLVVDWELAELQNSNHK